MSLVCLDAICSTSPPGIDPCTGQFSFVVPAADVNGNCIATADPGQLCFFVTHVNVTNKQMCNGKPAGDAPDPNGTGPCSGGFCPGAR